MKTYNFQQFLDEVQRQLIAAGKLPLTPGEIQLVRCAYEAGKAEADGGFEW